MNSSRRLGSVGLLWSVPVALALHNAEEAVGVRFLDAGAEPAAAWRRAWGVGSAGYLRFDLALVAITLAAFVIAGMSDLADPRGRGARTLVAIQAAMMVNALWHAATAIALGGYAPGVITALLVELPVSWAVLGTSWRERWLSRRATVAVAAVVAALHLAAAAALVARSGRGL